MIYRIEETPANKRTRAWDIRPLPYRYDLSPARPCEKIEEIRTAGSAGDAAAVKVYCADGHTVIYPATAVAIYERPNEETAKEAAEEWDEIISAHKDTL